MYALNRKIMHRNIMAPFILSSSSHTSSILFPFYQNWFSISVSDTGVGMSEDTKNHLFEPLITTRSKGIGLGFVVVQSFVHVHSGSIEVESSEGEGSTSTVRIPADGMEGN
jgi:signal transduction histidine kinase